MHIKVYLSLKIFLLLISKTISTIDINTAEFQYIADHLKPEECRKLVASLHFHTFELPNALDEAERRVSKDLTCLEDLLHWNSEQNGGKAETHELVSRRLRQIDRPELATWLTKTVYKTLGNDFDRESEEAFKPYQPLVLREVNLSTTERSKERIVAGAAGVVGKIKVTPPVDRFAHRRIAKQDFVPTETVDVPGDPTEWTIFDTISWTLVILLFLTIIGLMIYLIIKSPCINKRPKRCKPKRCKRYDCVEMEEEEASPCYSTSPICPRAQTVCPVHPYVNKTKSKICPNSRNSKKSTIKSNSYRTNKSYQCQSSESSEEDFMEVGKPKKRPKNCPALELMGCDMPTQTPHKYIDKPKMCQAMELMGCDMPTQTPHNKYIDKPKMCPAMEVMSCDVPTQTPHLPYTKYIEKCPAIIKSRPGTPVCQRPAIPAPCGAALKTIDIHQRIAIPMSPVCS